MSVIDIRISAQVVNRKRLGIVLENIADHGRALSADEIRHMTAGKRLRCSRFCRRDSAPGFVVPRSAVLQPDIDRTFERLLSGDFPFVSEFIVGDTPPFGGFRRKTQIDRARFPGFIRYDGIGGRIHISFENQIFRAGRRDIAFLVRRDIETRRRTLGDQGVIRMGIVLIDFERAAAGYGDISVPAVRQKTVRLHFRIHIAGHRDFRSVHIGAVQIFIRVNQSARIISVAGLFRGNAPFIRIRPRSRKISRDFDFRIAERIDAMRRLAFSLRRNIRISRHIERHRIRCPAVGINPTHRSTARSDGPHVQGLCLDGRTLCALYRQFIQSPARRGSVQRERIPVGIDIDRMIQRRRQIHRRLGFDIRIAFEIVIFTFICQNFGIHIRGIRGFHTGDRSSEIIRSR